MSAPDSRHRGIVYLMYRRIATCCAVAWTALSATSAALSLASEPVAASVTSLLAGTFAAFGLYHLGALRTLGKVTRGEL